MTMRVGLALPQLGPWTSGPVIRGFAERAEELGFGHLFVQQHLFYPHEVVSGYSARPGLAVPEAYRSVLQPMELLAASSGSALTGGAIMGLDPTTSAVNKYLQSWDVSNVFVVGASAFAHNAGMNPTGTVGALASE
mgnify:CR=1 FL=1